MYVKMFYFSLEKEHIWLAKIEVGNFSKISKDQTAQICTWISGT